MCLIDNHSGPHPNAQSTFSVMSNSYGPMDCNPPGSSVHGILQARILEWVAISYSRGSSRPRDRPMSPVSPAMAGGLFTTAPPRDPKEYLTKCFIIWNLFNPNNNSMWYYCPHLIYEETEAYGGWVTPQSPSGRAGCGPTLLIQTHYAAPFEEQMEDFCSLSIPNAHSHTLNLNYQSCGICLWSYF